MLKINPVEPTDRLKEMYGRNLLETLRPYILKNSIDVYTADGRNKLYPWEIDIAAGYTQLIPVPMYDSTSKATIIKYIVEEVSTVLRQYTDVQLIQDWYYDHKKNIVFSYIKEIFVYMSKLTKEEAKEPVAVLKLVFK